MKDSVKLGTNKTGIQMSPRLSEEMISASANFPLKSLDTSVTPFDLKSQYIRESGPVGTVPLPGSVKGAMNSALQGLKGNHPVVLVDKLGERLAFERSGVRGFDHQSFRFSP